jgi:stage III sporulation protein SpoIIIAA
MHRKELIQQLRTIYLERKNVLLVGPAGIGKTALLQEIRQALPLQICEETSSLGRICDRLEYQLGWGSARLSIIERKKSHNMPALVRCPG